MKRILTIGTAFLIAAGALVGCSTDADVVSHNLSKDAEQFNINRRIVFNTVNGSKMCRTCHTEQTQRRRAERRALGLTAAGTVRKSKRYIGVTTSNLEMR